jgi:hypothetical protein
MHHYCSWADVQLTTGSKFIEQCSALFKGIVITGISTTQEGGSMLKVGQQVYVRCNDDDGWAIVDSQEGDQVKIIFVCDFDEYGWNSPVFTVSEKQCSLKF